MCLATQRRRAACGAAIWRARYAAALSYINAAAHIDKRGMARQYIRHRHVTLKNGGSGSVS